MLAIVCGGLGMSLAPVRYNSTPEIVIITLKNK
jgi:predicted MPP superfamily phosphohydrolase